MIKRLAAFLATAFLSVEAFGQGRINFQTRNLAGGVDAPVWRDDALFVPAGAGITAQLFVVESEPAGAIYVPLFPTTTFLEGPVQVQRYVKPVIVEVPGRPAGSSVTVLMRAYEGATYEDALSRGLLHGQSEPTTIFALGGITPGDVTLRDAPLTGLIGFRLIPEPSSAVLSLLALALVIARQTARV